MTPRLRLAASLALLGLALHAQPAWTQALSSDEQLALRLACSAAGSGGAAEACRDREIREAATIPRPALGQLSFDVRMQLNAACAGAQPRGLAAFRRCQLNEVPRLLAAEAESPAIEEPPAPEPEPVARPRPAPERQQPPVRPPARPRPPVPAPPAVRQPAAVSPDRRLVVDMQRYLAQGGFYDGPLDGRFGPRTEQAIADFELTLGRAPTGQPSVELLQALWREVQAEAAPPEPPPPPTATTDPLPTLPELPPAVPETLPEPVEEPPPPPVVLEPEITPELPPEPALPDPPPIFVPEPDPPPLPVLPTRPPAPAATAWPSWDLLLTALLVAATCLFGVVLLVKFLRSKKPAPTLAELRASQPPPAAPAPSPRRREPVAFADETVIAPPPATPSEAETVSRILEDLFGKPETSPPAVPVGRGPRRP